MVENQRLTERYGADITRYFDTDDKRDGELETVEKFVKQYQERDTQDITNRYGTDMARYFENIKKGGFGREASESETDWTDEKLKDVLERCKVAVHDAIFRAKCALEVSYMSDYDANPEYYKKLAYEICRKHLDNYFYHAAGEGQ